jgi:hypothetical protein
MTKAVQKISLFLSPDVPVTKLLPSPPRDLSELGMERLFVTPFLRFRRGTPIRLGEGVLFATYATLRTEERGGKIPRVQRIVECLLSDFDRGIVFDESRAMQKAVSGESERRDQPASDVSGAEVLAKVLDRYAIERVTEREAA